MNYLKPFALALLAFLFLFAIASCSGSSKSALSPVEPGMQNNDLPISLDSNRDILAVYDAVIDPVAKSFTITPAERIPQYHFPLTQLYTRVLEITGYSWTPNFWADIKLKHPFPGTVITGYDPRVIAILPANPGVSFNYPTLGVNGNNSVVLEPDGYTALYDNLGGSIPGNVNPFKAYFKDQPYRVWSGTGVTEDTQRWQLNYSGFGGPLQFKLVVDVSTNYPNPAQPVIDNAQEPVQMAVTVGDGLTNHGGAAEIEVTLMDWQGHSGIGGVKVEAPDLFDGSVNLSFNDSGPNPNEYIYTGTLINSLLTPEGEYKILVAAWDQITENYLYKEFPVFVSYVNEQGNLAWAKRAGGTGWDASFGITKLYDNSTVVTGEFTGVATFGLGEANQTILTSAGNLDIFVSRYNTDGTLAWAKRAGGASDGYDCGFKITNLSDDSTIIVGSYWSTATFGEGEINQTTLTAEGHRDCFIARYKSDGSLIWAKSAGGANSDSGLAITTLSDNSIVATGWFEGTATFGKGESNQTMLTSAGLTDLFIARYNQDGTLSWAKRAGGPGTHPEYYQEITSLTDDSTIVTGGFNGQVTFGIGEPNQTVLSSNGDFDTYIARFNQNGSLEWAKSAGGLTISYGYGITSLSDDSVVMTGFFDGTITFGLGEPNETVMTSTGSYDICIARYNPDGSVVWAKQAGGTNWDEGVAITGLSDDSLVLTGEFNGTATFGAGEINETVLICDTSTDVFTARYNSDGSLVWAKRAGGAAGETGKDIVALSDNSTAIAGWFGYPSGGSATFGPGETNETVLTSAGNVDIFVARYAP